MRGCLSFIIGFLAIYIMVYLSYPETKESPDLSEYTDNMPKIPIPDSTREIEYFDPAKMEWKYKESIRLEYYRQRRRRIKPPDYEQQIIIEGKRYRLQHKTDGTHLIPIR